MAADGQKGSYEAVAIHETLRFNALCCWGLVPVPFKTSFEDNPWAPRAEIEAHPHVDTEDCRRTPVASQKQLMNFRLGVRMDVYTLDPAVIFD